MDSTSASIGSPARSLDSEPQCNKDGAQLTPRSKIRALLADIDESDSESLPRESNRHALAARQPIQSSSFHNDILSSGQDSTDEDTIIAPRGRLAARLQTHSNAISKGELLNHEEATTTDNIPKVSSEDVGEHSQDEELIQTHNQPRPKGLGRSLKRKRPAVEQDLKLGVTEDKGPSSPNNVFDHEEGQESTLTGTMRGESQEDGDNESDNESDRDLDLGSNRFQALVAIKRAERIAKEAVEEAKRAGKLAKRKKVAKDNANLLDGDGDGDSEDEDSEAGVRLTQKTRPVRKAGKKAMEEMARETQRISRNMQLAHEARTKKKITKESLLQRFLPKSTAIQPAGSSTNNSSSLNSEDEGTSQKQTPLTSPDQSISKTKATATSMPEISIQRIEGHHDLPGSNKASVKVVDKGKAKVLDLSFESLHPSVKPFRPTTGPETMDVELLSEDLPKKFVKELKQRPIRVLPPKNIHGHEVLGDDTKDDLEIVESKVFRVFDNLKKPRNADGKSRATLRALARLSSPSKVANGDDKPIMTPQELASMLRSKARQQAAAERAEKIEVLKSKGVIIRTAEEREKDQMDVEDMLEKARREDEELTKKEKEAEKKEKLARGEEIEESSGDEDYADHDDGDQEDLELSGSEEESADDDEEDDDNKDREEMVDDASQASPEINDDKAESKIESENAVEPINDGGNEEEENMIVSHTRNRNMARVIDDDSDDGEREEDHTPDAVPMLPLENPAPIQNPFGLQMGLDDAPMGLTQAFAATMADSQLREGFSQEDSLLQLRTMPSPEFGNANANFVVQDSNQAILDELDVDLQVTQTQIEQDTLPPNPVANGLTQLSEMPDPTQDVGFEGSSPLTGRFVAAPHSTIDTIILPEEASIPLAKKRGLLKRKQKRSLAVFSDEEDNDLQLSDIDSNSEEEDKITAFSVMKKAAAKSKRKELSFDKGKSDAKEMFEEQALESEDEYAGLGGVSDDSEGEEDEEIRKMIDEGDVEVNERKVAAYFAEKEREENEAGVSKLYKDINSGALRRKRGAGADFDDLDDSDDDHAARQARKQREFARMRKALLEGDSNIVKIADDPKKMPFLRAIEDRDDLEEFEFLHSTPPDAEGENGSQDVIPDSQSENRPPGVTKRRLDDPDSALPLIKPSTTLGARRPVWVAGKKPTTLADIQATLSFLTDEPDSVFSTKVGPSLFDVSSDIELDHGMELTVEDDLIGEPDVVSHSNPRRTGPRPNIPKFVDRLSLKKQESFKDSRSSNGQLAFMDPKFALERSFKPPTLLRKATSSFSNFSGQDENGISTNNNAKKAAMEPEVKGRGVGGGSKRSSVNWYAREAERKSALAKRSGKAKDSVTSNTRQTSGLSSLLGKASAWD